MSIQSKACMSTNFTLNPTLNNGSGGALYSANIPSSVDNESTLNHVGGSMMMPPPNKKQPKVKKTPSFQMP
jgi:hypothetical protein